MVHLQPLLLTFAAGRSQKAKQNDPRANHSLDWSSWEMLSWGCRGSICVHYPWEGWFIDSILHQDTILITNRLSWIYLSYLRPQLQDFLWSLKDAWTLWGRGSWRGEEDLLTFSANWTAAGPVQDLILQETRHRHTCEHDTWRKKNRNALMGCRLIASGSETVGGGQFFHPPGLIWGWKKARDIKSNTPFQAFPISTSTTTQNDS